MLYAENLVQALGLVLQFAGALTLAAVLGGTVAAIIQALFQIDEPVIGFAGRWLGVAISLWLGAGAAYGQLVHYTRQAWSLGG